MIKGRIISLDFGTKNIGVAVGQLKFQIVRPLISFKSNHKKPNWIILKQILQEWDPEIILVGFPLNMDGTEQNLTKKVKKFANQIRNMFFAKVILYDERLSTYEARSLLFENKKKIYNKKKLDEISAAVILESWIRNYP